MKILNFGSLNIDHVYRVKSFVTAGETVKSEEYIKKVGGKGLNQSIAIARAGAKVFHAGAVGVDGEFLTEFLKKDNVDVSSVSVSANATGHAIIQVDENGENCILLFGGANQSIKEEYVEKVLSDFSADDYIVLQNETNVVSFLMQKAHEKGMKVVFNPSPITDEMFSFPLKNVDWFILNEVEGEALTGENNVEKIREKLVELYPDADFILTLGKEGSVYFGKKGFLRMPAEKVDAVDTTAAGDTFMGYFVAEISKGSSVEDAMKIATKASSKTVTVLGAAESIPYYNQI